MANCFQITMVDYRSARRRSSPLSVTSNGNTTLPIVQKDDNRMEDEDDKKSAYQRFRPFLVFLDINRRIPYLYLIILGSIVMIQSYFQFNTSAPQTINTTPPIQTAKPLCVAMYENPNLSVSILQVYTEKYPTKRQVKSTSSLDQYKAIQKRKYHLPELEAFITEDCKPMHDWQIHSFPSCNKLHEADLAHNIIQSDFIRLINNGFFRDVWTIHDFDLEQTPRVLKTLRLDHDYIDRNYDRHRRDAVAMERLTASPYIVDIYGHCGNNGLFEYSNGGDIDHVLFTKYYRENPLQKYDRLRIAAQIANGIADAHYLDDKGRSTIAHTDITGGQFIFINGVFKLNDFNRARFIRWNPTKNESCGFKVGANRGDVSRNRRSCLLGLSNWNYSQFVSS